MMTFRSFVVAAALIAPAVSQSPNVLLILADDVGVDVIGCYGQPNAAPTPNIDALAAQDIRFDNAHACPTCSPTRASLLTKANPADALATRALHVVVGASGS